MSHIVHVNAVTDQTFVQLQVLLNMKKDEEVAVKCTKDPVKTHADAHGVFTSSLPTSDALQPYVQPLDTSQKRDASSDQLVFHAQRTISLETNTQRVAQLVCSA